jgi:hypothetical protein
VIGKNETEEISEIIEFHQIQSKLYVVDGGPLSTSLPGTVPSVKT